MTAGPEGAIDRLLGALVLRLKALCRERLENLVGRLEHIRDSRLRVRAFLGELAAVPPTVAVEMLHLLESQAVARDPEAQKIFLDILDENAVREVFSPELIDELWRLCRLRGYHQLVESLFYAGEVDSRLEEAALLPPDIRDIPLGRRKTMASTGNIGVLERLLLDSDVRVIKNLLSNPRITEREVVRLAAKRPNSPAVLAALAADRRWISRYSVKKALIYNPETPISVSVPLLKFLLRKDLLELTRFHAVNAVLRRAARELLGG